MSNITIRDDLTNEQYDAHLAISRSMIKNMLNNCKYCGGSRALPYLDNDGHTYAHPCNFCQPNYLER